VRVPWVPLNLGAFLIILGVFLIAGFINILSLGAGIPLTFAVFGIWLALLGVVMNPDSNPHGAPRPMVLGWGAVLAGLGILWFVGFNAGELLPLTFAVLVILCGIAAVGYSFMRAQPKKPSAAVA
jgi:hypothetical protein